MPVEFIHEIEERCVFIVHQGWWREELAATPCARSHGWDLPLVRKDDKVMLNHDSGSVAQCEEGGLLNSMTTWSAARAPLEGEYEFVR